MASLLLLQRDVSSDFTHLTSVVKLRSSHIRLQTSHINSGRQSSDYKH